MELLISVIVAFINKRIFIVRKYIIYNMKDCDDLELQVNAEEMCRTCLSQPPLNQLKPIFCVEIIDGKIIPFPKVLEIIMGVKPTKDECFPKNVCIGCKTKMKDLFAFKEKISKSYDLLYEIFGVEKPLQQRPCTKSQSFSVGSQTDPITVRETEFNLCSEFLSIERLPKPEQKEVSLQVKPTMRDSSSQAVSVSEIRKDVSVQVEDMVEQNEHLEAYLDEPEKSDELIESDIEGKPPFCNMDIIDGMSDSENSQNIQEENLEELDMREDIEENHEFDATSMKSKNNSNVKFEPLPEQDYDHEPVEYVTYEVIDECNDETSSQKSKSSIQDEPPGKDPFECKYCKYVTESKTSFTSHIMIHQQSLENIIDRVDYFRCGKCKTVYTKSAELASHFNADSCTAVDQDDFSESTDTQKHEHVYNNELDVCLPRMKSFYKDKSHIVCNECSLPFTNLSKALQHFASVHEKEDDSRREVNQIWEENGYDQIHVCGVCNDQFADASFIRQHVYFHRNLFECPYHCPERFEDFFKLTIHISKNHLKARTAQNSSLGGEQNSTQTEFECDVCWKRFVSKTSFKMHMKNHFAKRRFTCTMCPKAFFQKSDLTIHIRSHTDERPFTCTVSGCDKKFRTSSHRRDHMSTHAEEKKYQCDICQKHFKSERILQGHLRLHSGLKPYDCEQCGKSFSRKHHVKLHMKTHEKYGDFPKVQI
ncbi:zinc finger protein 699-like [Toxorhynchites rutilus septentrionalis]|uniref:zinc finger protein 699-like n=1 Tax=Toxorhynchites rutilus septentrionalis TaxID=329112 RepID=UPI00247A8967|nr:zinc finger protein 699-like [Toxorhynchites rutilus septentrionalis]